MKINFNIQSKIDKGLTIDQLRKVLFKSMLKMQELAIINCPVDKGRLWNGIKINPTTMGFNNYLLYDDVEYAPDVEFGTSPHIIRPNAKKALKFKSDGKTIFSKKVMHPGTRAQPFFRPALDQVKGIWVDRYFNQVMKKGK